jgi:tripartite-type tricarboxylate transporter receptor subunit TctC
LFRSLRSWGTSIGQAQVNGGRGSATLQGDAGSADDQGDGAELRHVHSWLGFFAPAGTPREIVSRLNGEINRALADPELAAKLEASALVRLDTTPEQFTEMVKKELELGARFAKMLGVKP